MSYAIFGLIFVLLVVFAVLSAKHWHWVNIVFLILTYIAGVAAAAGLSKALELRRSNMKAANTAEQRAEKSKADLDLAIYGSPNSITYDEGSLRGLNEQLLREMLGRGRVWSNGTVSLKDNNRVFQFSAARADGENPVPMERVLVYMFADRVIDGGKVPVDFIGTARVISETPSQVELEPVFIAQSNLYGQPGDTWSLFEKMPIDRRDTFKKHAGITDEEFDVQAYRDLLVNEYLRADELGMDPNSEAYEKLIDRYAFDGMKMGDIETYCNGVRRLQNFLPSPEEVFVEFRFDKKTDAVFEVDAGENSSIASSGAYLNGRAVDPLLKAGSKISFAKDDTVLVDQLTAEGYQRSDGQNVESFSRRYPVTEVDRYFRREVRDYPYMLADLRRQSSRFTDELARVKKNVNVTQGALDDATAQVNVRDDMVAKLQQDQDNLRADQAEISRLLQERTNQLDNLLRRSRELDEQIKSQYRMILGATTALSNSNSAPVASR